MPGRSELDIAVVTLDKPLSVPPVPMLWARVVRGETRPRGFVGTGFPAAAGTQSHPFFGQLTDVADADRLDLHIASSLPGNWKAWAGASGTMIFCDGSAVGVVASVDGRWTGKLSATPLHRLLSDSDFQRWYVDEGESMPSLHLLGGAREAPLDLIAGALHRLDRHDAYRAARDHLQARGQAAAAPRPPQLLVAAGLEADWHHKLMQQLAESLEVQRLLGREANAQEVIVELPWPREDRIVDPGLALLDLLGPMYAAAQLDPPAREDLSAVKERKRLGKRLDDGVSPRGYWTLLQQRQAYGGHGALLQGLIQFWAGLQTRHPMFLFLCLALDDPPRRKPPLLGFLAPQPPKPETDLKAVIKRSLAPLGPHLASLPDLDAIASHHVTPWINDLKRRFPTLNSSQLDLFGAALQTRLGSEGLRLAPLSACLGEVLFSSLHGVPQKGFS
jgi:hypothetical protein